MKNEKEYYNKKLEKILKLNITREKYGDLALILEDIFQRRAYEFDFSIEQMIDEVENFCKNVSSINFVSKDEMESENNMGVYCSKTSEIKINRDYFLELRKYVNENEWGEKIYETLAHEVFHAIDDKIKLNGPLGLMFYDPITNKYKGTALNEICVETAADRISISRNSEDATRFRRNTNGYPNITFVSNLLAASMGLTEKQFLAAGIKNRGKLMEMFSTKLPDDNFTDFFRKNLLEPFESKLDIIYNLNYNKENNSEYLEMEEELYVQALSGMYEDVYNMAINQITNSDRNLSKEYSAELMYRISKMETIMADSLEMFRQNGKISPNSIKTIKLRTIQTRTLLANIVNSLTVLETQKHKITDDGVLKEQIEKSKLGVFFEPDNILKLKETYNIEVNYINLEQLKGVTQDLSYSNFVLKEDFDNGLQWDNISTSIVMRKIFDKHVQEFNNKKLEKEMEETTEIPVITDDMLGKKEEGLFSKFKNGLKNIFTKFQNRNLIQLPEHIQTTEENQNHHIEKKNDFFEQYKVDEKSIDHDLAKKQSKNAKDVIEKHKDGEELNY